MFALGLSLII